MRESLLLLKVNFLHLTTITPKNGVCIVVDGFIVVFEGAETSKSVEGLAKSIYTMIVVAESPAMAVEVGGCISQENKSCAICAAFIFESIFNSELFCAYKLSYSLHRIGEVA